MRILILGGNGFIGSAVARRLAEAGHQVVGLARDIGAPARKMPFVTWRQEDIARLATAEAWRMLIEDVDAVVNCAGALQDGARDDVAKVQRDAMLALYEAAGRAPIKLIVQISANTLGSGENLAFLSTKRAADDALKRSGLPFVIFRPAIVVDRNAHGGTALLRALAVMPLAIPLAGPDAPMRFVALTDVCDAVAMALEGRIAAGGDIDLASAEHLTLGEAVGIHRRWQGLAPVPIIAVPGFAATAVSRIANWLGFLGWRSPLRSTAMEIAAGGISSGQTDHGLSPRTLTDTLLAGPAGVQDLWFARLYLLKAVIFATLSLFWLLSGVIALFAFRQSAALLIDAGFAPSIALSVTLATSLLDIVLGIAVIVRHHAKKALIAMILLSLGYLAAATIVLPVLWADPLGPLVKVIPAMVLALVALALFDER